MRRFYGLDCSQNIKMSRFQLGENMNIKQPSKSQPAAPKAPEQKKPQAPAPQQKPKNPGK